jgi:putative oxidoreductase
LPRNSHQQQDPGLIMEKYATLIAAAGRFLLAVLFILSGLSKCAAPAATQAYIASAGLPAPLISYLVAILVEVGGGVLILVGYQTRIAAAVVAVFTVVAALVFHTNFADQNQFIHFVKNLAITGGLLQVVAFGAGSLSIDSGRLRLRAA